MATQALTKNLQKFTGKAYSREMSLLTARHSALSSDIDGAFLYTRPIS